MRTYRDDEVREIFGRAAIKPSDAPPASSPQGMTLAQIQEIGREVGLDPAAVAHAAASLDIRPVSATPRFGSLGMPIEVRRIVPLPRAPTDEEWGALIGELRSTFGARGRVTTHPGLREWWNGNLHAAVERTADGYQLRIGTLKSNAVAVNAVGGVFVAMGVIGFGALTVAAGGLTDALMRPVLLGGFGTAALLANMVRLPRWASQRGRQMEHIAARATMLIRGPGPGGDRGVRRRIKRRCRSGGLPFDVYVEPGE